MHSCVFHGYTFFIASASQSLINARPPYIEEPPKLDLKPLLDNLKYAFLVRTKSLPIIIASNLDNAQEKIFD